MIKIPKFSPFRENILKAMECTATDEDLKKELHKLLEQKVEKEVPFLIKPKKNKVTLH